MTLFEGEELFFDSGISSIELSDQEINEKYVKGDVRIVTEQARYPLPSIPSMVSGGGYDLNPEFQRRHRWNIVKKSHLIESFIMNVPIPPIFLYEVKYSQYEVMDGLQRLTAISEFYGNKFALEGLEEWPELNGRKYSELPEKIKSGVDRRYLSSIILLHETAKSEDEARWLKQLVFERINSGGVRLEDQESRNAIYNGPLNQLCIKLARNEYLCKTWGIPIPIKGWDNEEIIPEKLLQNERYRKMFDVELVLRFFAYRQRLNLDKGTQKIFLDNYLKFGNNFSETVLTKLEDLFDQTIKLVFDTFGEKAFWLRRVRNSNWIWYRRPTTVVFDPLMYVFSKHIDEKETIAKHTEKFREGIKELYQENYESFEGRYTNLANIRERNKLFENLVASIIG